MEETIYQNLPSDTQNSKILRLAASLFFLLCLPMSIWSEMYVPSKIFVALDPVATANNLLSNESIFRTAMLGHVAGIFIFVFVMMLFHRVFSPVDKHLGRLMFIPLIVMISIVFVSEIFNYSALMTLKSEARPTFGVAQQQETAYFLMRIHRYGMSPTKFILGLSFIPLGLMIMRSGFVPRIIGILVIISGVGYLIDSCTYVLLQRQDYLMIGPYMRYLFVGFMLALIWFIVKGVKSKEVGIRH
jgi:hypothetical protein